MCHHRFFSPLEFQKRKPTVPTDLRSDSGLLTVTVSLLAALGTVASHSVTLIPARLRTLTASLRSFHQVVPATDDKVAQAIPCCKLFKEGPMSEQSSG